MSYYRQFIVRRCRLCLTRSGAKIVLVQMWCIWLCSMKCFDFLFLFDETFHIFQKSQPSISLEMNKKSKNCLNKYKSWDFKMSASLVYFTFVLILLKYRISTFENQVKYPRFEVELVICSFIHFVFSINSHANIECHHSR